MPQTNAVANSGFETGSSSSWLSQNASINSSYSHTGIYSAQLAGGSTNSFLSQFVPVSAGDNVEFLFSIAKIGSLPSPPVSASISYSVT